MIDLALIMLIQIIGISFFGLNRSHLTIRYQMAYILKVRYEGSRKSPNTQLQLSTVLTV